MTDTRHLSHFEYDAALLDAVGLTHERLPPLLPFGDVVGTVTDNVAADLGLSSDTMVITGVTGPARGGVGFRRDGTLRDALGPFYDLVDQLSLPQKENGRAAFHCVGPGTHQRLLSRYQQSRDRCPGARMVPGVLAGTGPVMSYEQMTTSPRRHLPGPGASSSLPGSPGSAPPSTIRAPERASPTSR